MRLSSNLLRKKVSPAIERRIRTELTEKAEEGAIQLFSDNLRNLLLVAPLKGTRGFRDLTLPFVQVPS